MPIIVDTDCFVCRLLLICKGHLILSTTQYFLQNFCEQAGQVRFLINGKNLILYPVGIYLLKIKDKNTRTRCEICSKLTTKTPERRYWRRSSAFIANYEHISHIVLIFYC